MTPPDASLRPADDSDIARVTLEFTARLRTRGIDVRDDDTTDDVVLLMESVEAFERAVQLRGGDLMMDEPPANQHGEPDDPRFLLLARGEDEVATAFVQRLAIATSAIRKQKQRA